MVASIERNVKNQIDLQKIELELKQLCDEKRKAEIHLGMMERSKEAEKKIGVMQ